MDVVASELTHPVFVAAVPGNTDRLVVVQQNGMVRLLTDGAFQEEAFLDRSALVSEVSDQGRGLLSLAFDPRYEETGYLFVSYTDRQDDSQIDRFTVHDGERRVDISSRTPVLTIDQPIGDHNGGHIALGPDSNL